MIKKNFKITGEIPKYQYFRLIISSAMKTYENF